jgi:hypothetical protein
MVASEILTASPLFSNTPPTNPPRKIPATKNKFHISDFQLYFKKAMLKGATAAQVCLSDDDMPNILFPRMRSNGIDIPIIGPLTYQGQGSFNNSSILFF